MKKCVLIAGFLIVAGCSSPVARWEDAGTLVSMRPAEEPSRSPGRLGAVLGETELGRTRVETTKGTYIVEEKINVSEIGAPVKLGYAPQGSSSDSQDTPCCLSIGNKRYRIAR